jgi:hypothetical protein
MRATLALIKFLYRQLVTRRANPIFVDMGNHKAAQHKEHVHCQIALVHGSRIALGVNSRQMPAEMKYYDPHCSDAAQRGERGKLLGRSGKSVLPAVAGLLRRSLAGSS